MTPQERKSRTATLFNEALIRTADQRSAFLSQACAGDEQLLQRVKELIDAYAGVKTSTPSSGPNQEATLSTLDPDVFLALGERYDNIDFIGSGGMGVVFRAHDRELDKVVALKVLHPNFAKNEQMIERFRKEIRLALDITHKNVCRTYGLERLNGNPVIAMEYVDGETMRNILDRVKGVSVPQGLAWSREICEALTAAHDKRIVHRDLKPENIMVDRDGHIKVMDFGIARSLEAATHASGTIIGTPGYMSPEQSHGSPLEPSSDIYSLGLVLYELFTGGRPAPARFVAPVAVNPYLPANIDHAICKCLKSDPKDRFQDAKELRVALSAEKSATGSLKSSPKGKRILSFAGVVGLCALVVAFLIVGFFIKQSRQGGIRQYDDITALAFSPDGRLLASASEDKTIVLSDIIQQRKLLTLAGHIKAVVCLAFSEDSRWLASGSADKTIKTWEVSSGRLSHTFSDAKSLVAVALSPDGRWLASSTDEKAKVWDVQTGRVAQVLLHKDEVQELAFSPNGRLLASASSDSTAAVWDVETGRLVGGPLNHDDEVLDVVFSPDGRLLATGSLDKSIKLWSTASWELVQTLWQDERVSAISFDNAGTLLLSVGENGKVKLWQAPTWRNVANLMSEEKDKSPTWAFGPDGRTLAIGTSDGRVVLQALPRLTARQ